MRNQIGKFEIKRLLGQGTMGEVYLARDPGLDREVAIKTILPGNAFGAESAILFEREARAMAALNHPNILTLYDHGVDDGLHYLVMEYLEGVDLATLIRQRQFDRDDLLEALAQACEGLAYAHQRGIVHRDVKPGNIMVTRRGGQVVAKLMDFGIAAMDRFAEGPQEGRVGTLHYLAPEYLDSGLPTPGADLFAAGVILYELLSGRKPFTGETATEVLGAILHQPPAPLDPEGTSHLPAMALALVERALAKDPLARFASAELLAAAIRRMRGAATQAAPPPPEPAGKQTVVGRGPRANCLSLRVALRQALAGSTILVLPGSYKEALVVDREVAIRGEGEPGGVVLAGGLTIELGGILTLANLTVEHAAGTAMTLLAGARLTAMDCWFQGAPAGGLELGPGSVTSLLRCRVTNNGFAGVLALEGSRADLQECQLSGNQEAGLHATGGALVNLAGCLVERNLGLGVSAVGQAEVALDRCQLAANQGPGVLLQRGGSGALNRCFVTQGLSLGIVCRQGGALSLAESRIQGNARGGLLLAAGAAEPVMGESNRILDPILRPPAQASPQDLELRA